MQLLHSTPAADHFSMPAEFSPHAATVLIWPIRPGSWGTDPSSAQQAFCQVIERILESEPVFLLAGKANIQEAQEAACRLQGHNGITVLPIESDDAWARDVGPTFVTNRKQVRGISWRFNAWGGRTDGLYAHWEKDDALAPALCGALGCPCYDAGDFVLEGGSIHTDGEGTLLTTESCLLSAGRNPNLSRKQIEKKLKTFLGIQKILWLPRGIYHDETNEHVDNVCAFTAPGKVVLAWTEDRSDPQFPLSSACLAYLEKQTDAKGRKLQITKLPIPEHPICCTEKDCAAYSFEPGEDTREPGERLAASYVNFYFTNESVLIPQFGGENRESDARAFKILQQLCPSRKMIGIPARAILQGGGNIHCITQQIPKGEEK